MSHNAPCEWFFTLWWDKGGALSTTTQTQNPLKDGYHRVWIDNMINTSSKTQIFVPLVHNLLASVNVCILWTSLDKCAGRHNSLHKRHYFGAVGTLQNKFTIK